jgi:hypothetical protein
MPTSSVSGSWGYRRIRATPTSRPESSNAPKATWSTRRLSRQNVEARGERGWRGPEPRLFGPRRQLPKGCGQRGPVTRTDRSGQHLAAVAQRHPRPIPVGRHVRPSRSAHLTPSDLGAVPGLHRCCPAAAGKPMRLAMIRVMPVNWSAARRIPGYPRRSGTKDAGAACGAPRRSKPVGEASPHCGKRSASASRSEESGGRAHR